MTLNQLHSLDEQELALALVIVNDIAPPVMPKMTFEPRHLTWFNHEQLIKKFLEIFSKLNPEGHATYVSLMQKLGVCIQIQQHPNPNPNETDAKTTETAPETTASAGLPQTSSVQPDVQAVTGSNAEGQPA
jgi:hypothetical protein